MIPHMPTPVFPTYGKVAVQGGFAPRTADEVFYFVMM